MRRLHRAVMIMPIRTDKKKVHTSGGKENRRGISADPIECRLRHGQEAGEAHDQIQGQTQDGIYADAEYCDVDQILPYVISLKYLAVGTRGSR